jgi:hypothetical protein
MIGPNWLNACAEDGSRRLDNPDDFVRTEIATALQRDIPVIPILLDGGRVPNSDQLPSDLKRLARRNALEVRHTSFRRDLDKLIRGLKAQPRRPTPQNEGGSEKSAPVTVLDRVRGLLRVSIQASSARGLRSELIHLVIGGVVGVSVAYLLLTWVLIASPYNPGDTLSAVLTVVFVASASTLFWREALITAERGWAPYGIVAFIVFVFYLSCLLLFHPFGVLYHSYVARLEIGMFLIFLGFIVAEAAVALLFVLRRRHQRAMSG